MAPRGAGGAGVSPLVVVQKLVMVTKAWGPYFMEPQSPWEALDIFKRLMGTIPINLKDFFEFIKTWLHIACTKERVK